MEYNLQERNSTYLNYSLSLTRVNLGYNTIVIDTEISIDLGTGFSSLRLASNLPHDLSGERHEQERQYLLVLRNPGDILWVVDLLLGASLF